MILTKYQVTVNFEALDTTRYQFMEKYWLFESITAV